MTFYRIIAYDFNPLLSYDHIQSRLVFVLVIHLFLRSALNIYRLVVSWINNTLWFVLFSSEKIYTLYQTWYPSLVLRLAHYLVIWYWLDVLTGLLVCSWLLGYQMGCVYVLTYRFFYHASEFQLFVCCWRWTAGLRVNGRVSAVCLGRFLIRLRISC